MAEGKVGAIPHDLMKAVVTRGHTSRKLVEQMLPENVKGKYLVACKDSKGNEEFHKLEEVIVRHHAWGRLQERELWERLWKFSDMFSVVAGRFRLEYDYWRATKADPFFVRAYASIKEWRLEERNRLWKSIVEILMRYRDEKKQSGAFAEINELLREVPAESRFPYVSLKTHHWLTDAIRENEVFRKRVEEKKYSFKKMYLIRVSLAEPEIAHKLKEQRSFRELHLKITKIASHSLLDRFPLQIGDDLYLVCLEDSEISEIRRVLAETGFGFDVDVFEWTITTRRKRVVAEIKGPMKPRSVFLIKESKSTSQSIGVHEEFEYMPESYAEWAKILDGEYNFVAWISIVPTGRMEQIAEEFLEWGEEELKEKKKDRVPLPEPVRANPFLSPELAISIADGYNDFLGDCAVAINEEDPEANTVCRSFSRAMFIRGINEPSEAYELYNRLAALKLKLHFSASLSVVTAKPKYPFWRTCELFDSKNDCLKFVVGEKVVQLTDKHAALIRGVKERVGWERKRQFYRVVNAACEESREMLKVKIEGFAAQEKLSRETAFNLCRLVDEIARQCGNDEKLRKQITCEVFKVLRMFTR